MPEVAQFESSQQLLNPNEIVISTQQPITQNTFASVIPRQQCGPIKRILQKLRLPSEIKEEGGEGIPKWFLGRDIIALMREFREHVISKNLPEVKDFIKNLIDEEDSELNAEYLCELVCNRATSEPSKEALLTSILIGSRPLVEFILQLFAEFPGEERNGVAKSDAFAPYITPLMLACICDNYAVVECLLLRGHKIDLPHRTDCLCSSCGKIAHSFSGRHQRLDTYRSLSSEAYLWLATRDPLLSAINLAEDLMVCQSYDTEHAVSLNREMSSLFF
uniref:Transient receptor ion channel domain-containing protein n=1 Tax=Panagrolaimus davidi TaxID=227884 RepID=A0A914QMG6_9BILA